jgi:hypothetical protein
MADYEAAAREQHKEPLRQYYCMRLWQLCDWCFGGDCPYRMPIYAAKRAGLWDGQ